MEAMRLEEGIRLVWDMAYVLNSFLEVLMIIFIPVGCESWKHSLGLLWGISPLGSKWHLVCFYVLELTYQSRTIFLFFFIVSGATDDEAFSLEFWANSSAGAEWVDNKGLEWMGEQKLPQE